VCETVVVAQRPASRRPPSLVRLVFIRLLLYNGIDTSLGAYIADGMSAARFLGRARVW